MPIQASVANESRMFNQETNNGLTETDGRFWYQQNTLLTANKHNSALYSTLVHEKQDIYEDMAVGDEFLNEYFSQV